MNNWKIHMSLNGLDAKAAWKDGCTLERWVGNKWVPCCKKGQPNPFYLFDINYRIASLPRV